MTIDVAESAGQKRYWPIYRAASDAGLPVGIHTFGFGGYPVSGGGCPSFYIKRLANHAAERTIGPRAEDQQP